MEYNQPWNSNGSWDTQEKSPSFIKSQQVCYSVHKSLSPVLVVSQIKLVTYSQPTSARSSLTLNIFFTKWCLSLRPSNGIFIDFSLLHACSPPRQSDPPWDSPHICGRELITVYSIYTRRLGWYSVNAPNAYSAGARYGSWFSLPLPGFEPRPLDRMRSLYQLPILAAENIILLLQDLKAVSSIRNMQTRGINMTRGIFYTEWII